MPRVRTLSIEAWLREPDQWQIAELVRVAARALAMLPPIKGPGDQLAWWPDVKRERGDYGWDEAALPRRDASRDEIEALAMLERLWTPLDADARAILVMRGLGMSWRAIARVRRRIARRLGLPLSHESCRLIHRAALMVVERESARLGRG